ncbi:MAG: MerR family transcriptional regulator [Lachnospiraceae bacterium]|nr:MerR family transcriptional regulator [Lachnospiraceae bacterium]
MNKNIKAKLMTLAKFSSITGIKSDKLRYWDRCGKLEPAKRTDGGFRYYSQEQIPLAMSLDNKRTIVAYTCSTRSNWDEIEKENNAFVEKVKGLEPDGHVVGVYEQWTGTIEKSELERIIKCAQIGQVEKVYYYDKNWFISGKWEDYKQFLSYMGTELIDFKDMEEEHDTEKI